MNLLELLKQNQNKIESIWKEQVLQIKLNGQVVVAGNQGQFTNPVHFTISGSLTKILQALLDNTEISEETLDDILRIRAVQTMPPSQAISFLHILKEIIRDIAAKSHPEELLKFESKIDGLLSRSFDIYMACREQIFKLKLTENQKGVFADVAQGAGCPSALLDQIDMENNKNKLNQSGGRK